MAVYERGKSILKAMEELEGGISEYTSGVRGLIRLSANPSAITQFLPDDLAAYSQMFPEVQVDIEERLSSEIVASVTDGSADIGIFSEHQGEHDFQTRVYRRDTLVAISAVGHSLTKRTDIRFSDLLAYNHVGLANGSSLQAKLIQKAREVGLDIRFSVRVHSFDGIRRFVEAGLGVAVLPHGAVRPFLSNTNLVCHDIHEEWATRSLLLGFRDYRSLSVVARKFVDFIAPD
ncbi:MAG: LysR family transcriptional regulator [Mesorhizobium amorphae]|nr:MAG: LysR family transcriptional regulator [Mesorhizobium amorphae]